MKPLHVPDSGPNGMSAGYVRCLPSGAVHPVGYDCEQKKAPVATGANQEER